MSLEQISNAFLVLGLVLYTAAFFTFVVAVTGKKWSNREPLQHQKRWSIMAFAITLIGWFSHLTFFITRWIAKGSIPTSNMFEFMTFLGMMIIFSFLIIYFIYRSAVLGMFALPVGITILAYASVFPWEVQPLIPALNVYWLKIHVTLAAAGESFFAVGFAAGLMYLMRTVDFSGKTKASKRSIRGVEFSLLVILIVFGFVGGVFGFRAIDYEATFQKEIMITDEEGNSERVNQTIEYVLPPVFKPYGSETLSMKPFLGMEEALFETPSWMQGQNSGRKLNTMLWSILFGLILYGIIRLIIRKPIGAAIQPAMHDLDPEDLDEISYRAIAIGFPIFTLGALITAMIWAHIAWGRFWGWDPKEVWALITWLFYSAYLHLRLSQGWHGGKSSWLAVIGFVIVMFTLVGVNLVLSGLHAYSGVD